MTKRYTIDMPEAVGERLQEIATRRSITRDGVVSAMVKLFFVADALEQEATPIGITNSDGSFSEVDIFGKGETTL